MNNGELLVSAETLIHIFVFLLYASVVLISYWKLMPRLSPTSRRLASAMLAAQVLVIAVSLDSREASPSYSKWLWHLDLEWNIPSTLASTQLALVGGVALITAWFAKAQPTWQRLYLVAISLVFLYLARDEYFEVHEVIQNWERYYVAGGVLVAAATAAVSVRSPRRVWHLCLLTGLAMSAAGGIGLDSIPLIWHGGIYPRTPAVCGSLGFLHIDGCLYLIWFEETLEFLGIWLTLLAILGQFSDTAPPRIQRILYTLPALWIFLLFLYCLVPRLELRLLAQPAAVQFKSGVSLHGYRIDIGEEAAHIQLYASGRQQDYLETLGYSIHLVDQVSGASVASRYKRARHQQTFWLLGPDYMPIYRHQIKVRIPPQASTSRALWIVLTLWRKEEEDRERVRQEILASDHQLLDDTQVVLDELALPTAATAPPTVPLALFDSGFMLDAVDIPARAQPGETLTIPFTWRSSSDGSDDLVQFLHFGHEASGAWWVYDQQPLGPRLPTRLWYNGLVDTETWNVPLPAGLAPGRYAIFTGLYRQSDLERVPASDADGRPWLGARVPLGSLMIEQ